MKILFAAPPQGYSEELLFYGLTEVLGTENVVDYPRFDHLWDAPKPKGYYTALSGLLHGQTEPDRNGLGKRVDARDFDLVVVSNRSWHFVPLATYTKLPVVFIDGEDDANEIFHELGRQLGPRLYFKRELYMECEFFKPLPFCYPEKLATGPTPAKDRPLDCVAVFGVNHWPREQVVKALGEDFPDVQLIMEPDTGWLGNAPYLEKLQQAKIGIDVRGFGFTTLRRWEIVAHGAMLLCQKLPILIPNDFFPGSTCVELDSLIGLADWIKTACSSDNMGRYIEDVAQCAWDVYLKHHTTKARAEAFLNTCKGVL